jgi:hypothetical protein
MILTRAFLLCAVLAAAMAPAVAAQEVVRLKDGTAADAKVFPKGKSLRLVSVFGERIVDADDVVSRERSSGLESQYAEQLRQIPQGFTAGHAALARWCFDNGLLRHAKEQLDLVFDKDIDHAVAREVAARIAADWKLDPVEGSKRTRDLSQVSELLFERVAPSGLTEAVIAAEKAKKLPEEHCFRRALKGLKHEKPEVRWMSAHLLAAFRSEPERIKPLFKRALIDPAFAVRTEATRALKVTNDPVFVKLFAKNLLNPTEAVRIHAAEAIGELGMKEGIEPLLNALADSFRPTRNFVAVTTQTAYVKDFDVEIAQAAVIADPIVDVVQEGSILDVGVVGVTIERGVYGSSLAKLTGAQLGTDPGAWRRYLANR